jgi:RES domain-containing protein
MADLEPLARAFEALAYRAHNPRWAYLPTSGEGAARHGGRFNRRGVPALYLSLDLTTAWLEAQQGLPFKAQPMTLVAYRVCCRRIADLTGPDILTAVGVDPAELACAWEDLAGRGEEPPSWRLADAVIAAPRASTERWCRASRRPRTRRRARRRAATWSSGGGRRSRPVPSR